jgi:hypothetical protein
MKNKINPFAYPFNGIFVFYTAADLLNSQGFEFIVKATRKAADMVPLFYKTSYYCAA